MNVVRYGHMGHFSNIAKIKIRDLSIFEQYCQRFLWYVKKIQQRGLHGCSLSKSLSDVQTTGM